MSALNNLNKRLSFWGGVNQEDRMDFDKLKSLKKALLYSYQAQTAILNDNREFKCLINHDKLKEDYDDKIISIPYDDVCLNADDFPSMTPQEVQHIGMKIGDTFTWKETSTRWIVIQEILEENAYFRATIRKAEDEIVIDGKTYYGYLGKWTKGTLWHTKGLNSWSEMGYEVVLYITRDEVTESYFHRFKKIQIGNRLWEVQFVNDLYSDTMLIIYMKETFINEFENAEADQNAIIETPDGTDLEPAILGNFSVYPFDTITYIIKNADGGTWSLSNNKAQIVNQTSQEVTITITYSKKATIDLIYTKINGEKIIKTIIINSL